MYYFHIQSIIRRNFKCGAQCCDETIMSLPDQLAKHERLEARKGYLVFVFCFILKEGKKERNRQKGMRKRGKKRERREGRGRVSMNSTDKTSSGTN